jgi:histidinol phosphatase-like PHP family hydrolase
MREKDYIGKNYNMLSMKEKDFVLTSETLLFCEKCFIIYHYDNIRNCETYYEENKDDFEMFGDASDFNEKSFQIQKRIANKYFCLDVECYIKEFNKLNK